MKKIETVITEIIQTGESPAIYRLGLASAYGMLPEQVDAIVATLTAGPAIAQVDPEAAAQARLCEERAARKADPRGARRYDHEEE